MTKKLLSFIKLNKKYIINILLIALLCFLAVNLAFLYVNNKRGNSQIKPIFQSTEANGANSISPTIPPPPSIALGNIPAWSAIETPAQGLADYKSLVGVKPAIQMWFIAITEPFPTASMDAIAARGVMPELSIELPDYSQQQCQDNPMPCTDKYVTDGNYDASLHRFAHAAAAWGKPFLYRFIPEMNGDWNYYAPGLNGNTASSIVALWRHVVNLFVADRATNAQFVWTPNIIAPDAPDFRDLYPGDSYVSWIGLDGYNFGTSNPNSTWTTFDDLYQVSYDELVGLAPAKPLMLSEISSAEQGGSKAAWITNTFTEIPLVYSHIKAIVWFNTDKTSEGETDWRINSSPEALQSFRAIAHLPVYQGSVI